MKRLLVGPLVLIVAWCALSLTRFSESVYFPQPFGVASSIWRLFLGSHLYGDVLMTTSRSLVGFGVAAILGVPLGLWLGMKHEWRTIWELPVDFFRAIPSPVLFPIVILLFGVDELAKISVVVYTCFFINLVYSYYGARDVDQAKYDLFDSLKASRKEIFKKLLVWAALPRVFAGLRITLSIALILVVITEMLGGAPDGLGVRIYDAASPHRVSERYALIIVLGLLGYTMNRVFVKLEDTVIHWRGV